MWLIETLKKLFGLDNRKGYFFEPSSIAQMIQIKCAKCDVLFEFDDEAVGAIGPSGPNEESAQKYVVDCPYCGAPNMIWLGRPTASPSHMDVIIVRNEPQDFR